MSDYFVFDDIDTRTFDDIYVAFDKVDKTPARAYEVVEVPGRNGSIFLDENRYDDEEHVYHIAALTKEAGSNLINALSSKVGYYRLSDSFNSDEYYMAVFTSGADPKISSTRDANTFKLTFTRKPQRFLTSGETKSAVASGNTVTNPTKFGASPLLEYKGYGNIWINGIPITIASVPIGNILLANSKTVNIRNATRVINPPPEISSITFDGSKLNTGDAITLAESYVRWNIEDIAPQFHNHYAWLHVESTTGESWETSGCVTSAATAYYNTKISGVSFEKGTSATKSYSYSYKYRQENESGSQYSESSGSIYIKVEYDGNQTIKLYASTNNDSLVEAYELVGYLGQVNGYSTIVVNDTFYIDLDIGEAYYISNNVYSSANYAVTLPAKLPKLKSGANIITYSNTITNFKLTPRWWKL